MSTTSFNDLPEETAAGILLRLSVKDLIRSTSVNKTWYSLINNPSFISAQISRCISHCNDNAVLIIPPLTSIQNYCSLISADTSTLIEKFHIPFETKTRTLKLVAEIDGLLLLTDLQLPYASRELYLWNPYVKTHRVLLSSCFKKFLDIRSKSSFVVGMGFDKLTNDYKVARIVYVEDAKFMLLGEVAPKVEIFSLRKNTWRRIKDAVVPILAFDSGTYVDGSFYWLEMSCPESVEIRKSKGKKFRILSFDFVNEAFGEVKVPVDALDSSGEVGGPYKLMKFEGSLAFCVLVGDGNPYCIWLMRHENGVFSWRLRFKAVLKVLGWPLNITNNETLIVEKYSLTGVGVTNLFSCNLKSRDHKDLGFGIRGLRAFENVYPSSTVGTCLPESLIMYEGGKLLLKHAN
ncbi:hypothetical protein AgCh_001789 [Apium graveolens]